MLNETIAQAAAAVAAAGGAVSADVQQAIASLDTKPQQHQPQQASSLPVVVAPPTSSSSASASAPPADNVTWVPRGSASIQTDRAIVLDNATQGYKKPNIMDVKLGRRLWGDSAPLQKRQRMDEVCAKTTHAKYGFRISGMLLYQGDAAAAASPDPTSDSAGYRVYDKDYGRTDVNENNVIEAFRTFLFNESAGVDRDHGRAMAEAFKAELERVRDVLENERTRMYSSSLLFVYEGDGPTLKEAVALGNARATAREATSSASLSFSSTSIRVVEAEAACEEPETAATVTFLGVESAAVDVDADHRSRSRREVLGKAADRSSSRTDSGIVIDDDDEEDEVDVQNLTEVDFSFGDDVVGIVGDENDSDDDEKMPPIYGLRLIDFAHAKFVKPEEGPDENNLAGVRSLIAIFDELAK
jgi:inositol-polyphosphate multikinase